MENLKDPSNQWTEHQWFEYFKHLEKLAEIGRTANSTSVELNPVPEPGELRPLPFRGESDLDTRLPLAA